MIQNVLVEALAIGHALWMHWMRRSRRILDKIGQCVALGHPSQGSGTAECNGSGVSGLKGMLGTNRPVAPGASLHEMACGERNLAREYSHVGAIPDIAMTDVFAGQDERHSSRR